MTYYILVKYVHLLSVFGMVGCLVAELVLVKLELARREIKRIGKIDGLYGLCAITLVAAGFTMWFGVGKGSDFYSQPALYIKLVVATIVGILSIWPTRFYMKNGKGSADEITQVPNYVRKLIIIQLILMALVPPLATMMAYGISPF